MIEGPLAELTELATLLRERTGLATRADGYAALRQAMLVRLADLRLGSSEVASYIALLRSPDGDEEMSRLLPLVTVGKTGFFRDERQFRALEALLPGMIEQARRRGRPVSVWSAGCATGEEVYSIAMSAAKVGAAPGDLSILGTDVNADAVAVASLGLYSARKVKSVPQSLFDRWFVPQGKDYRVAPDLRSWVKGIRAHNLMAAIWPTTPGSGWDAIFCRNVIIYFDVPTTQRLLARFFESLAPGGCLFLGYSESLYRLFSGFELKEAEGAYLYRKPLQTTPIGAGATLVQEQAFSEDAGETARRPAPELMREEVAGLLERGRFTEARGRLEDHLARREDLGLRLTLANLYDILRDPSRAKTSYLKALDAEPLSAEAHLFFGVHLVAEGDLDTAALELSRALFLDPGSVLAHYFLGRCREGQKDPSRARLCYRNALNVWRREPGTRGDFLGHYPDLPADAEWARAAESALGAL